MSLSQNVPDYRAGLASLNLLESKPLKHVRIGIIQETLGEGVDTGVISSIKAAASHLEQLGSVVEEVCCFHLAGEKMTEDIISCISGISEKTQNI